MKQIEITTRVNNTLEEVDSILTKQEFKVIRKSRIEDNYKTSFYNELRKDNILEILPKCVLIRYADDVEGKELKRITYKNKVYENDIVISEEKISVDIDDINKANKIFEALGFKTIVNVNYDIIVYSNENIELCFQDVEGLGLLLEYENGNDFDGVSNEEIMKEKEKMLEEIKTYNLDITNDIDVKKAFELIFNNL